VSMTVFISVIGHTCAAWLVVTVFILLRHQINRLILDKIEKDLSKV
jgi:hypothetical protein